MSKTSDDTRTLLATMIREAFRFFGSQELGLYVINETRPRSGQAEGSTHLTVCTQGSAHVLSRSAAYHQHPEYRQIIADGELPGADNAARQAWLLERIDLLLDAEEHARSNSSGAPNDLWQRVELIQRLAAQAREGSAGEGYHDDHRAAEMAQLDHMAARHQLTFGEPTVEFSKDLGRNLTLAHAHDGTVWDGNRWWYSLQDFRRFHGRLFEGKLYHGRRDDGRTVYSY